MEELLAATRSAEAGWRPSGGAVRFITAQQLTVRVIKVNAGWAG